MRISITHDQADFDGVASTFCAHVVDNQTIPVLPNRLNRNVKAFLSLYGSEFPFVNLSDLNGSEVDSVLLVDTQTLIQFKGQESDISISIIDHHRLRESTRNVQDVFIDDTGANTTIFVEMVQERSIFLTSIQATLLLLGIYEDTGSLSYESTTSRDVRAAAFLIDTGANLNILSKFISLPLTDAQREIYHKFYNNTEIVNIHGYNVSISSAKLEFAEDELSSIAHKLLDFLDPDALIVCAKLSGYIQLIIRSTTDAIDASVIANVFGGGGHRRAAAAVVKNRSLTEVRALLIETLENCIEPASTVASIMSKRPLLITPNTSAKEADLIMRKFGYEGYPVVDGNKIIGLLTRRAVDRALNHNLNLTASSLMQAGEFYVRPDDPIERLQTVMIQSGWGQIPVQDEQDNIVGIVTRTDLIKLLGMSILGKRPMNLSNKIADFLPPILLKLLLVIAKFATAQNSALYIVGGFVRDLLLETPSLDLDLVVEGDAVELGKSLSKYFGGKLVVHSRFGTAKWIIREIKSDKLVEMLFQYHTDAPQVNLAYTKGEIEKQVLELPDTLDLISARSEFYTHPTALPIVKEGSIKLDLHRRDFTINTLAVRLDGQHFGNLYDFWGGLDDLKQGIIRVLHSLSFIDDPTRMLRAVRYEQRYNFKIDDRTLLLLREALPLLKRVSGDRIRHEIDAILMESKVLQMLIRLDELGLLKAIHPNLHLPETFLNILERGDIENIPAFWSIENSWKGMQTRIVISYLVWFGQGKLATIKPILKRLRIKRQLFKAIVDTSATLEKLTSMEIMKPSEFIGLIENLPMVGIYACYLLTSPNETIKSYFVSYVKEWRNLKPMVTGDHLKNAGIVPGPIYKKILKTIRNAWIDGEIRNEAEEKNLLNVLLRNLNENK